MTHTLALMELSEATVAEITNKLLDAGYDHAVIAEKDGIMLDMTGIGIVKAKP